MSGSSFAELNIQVTNTGVSETTQSLKNLATQAETTEKVSSGSMIALSQRTLRELDIIKMANEAHNKSLDLQAKTQLAGTLDALAKKVSAYSDAANKELQIEADKQAKLKAMISAANLGIGGSGNVIADDSAARAAKQKDLKEISDERIDNAKKTNDKILAMAELLASSSIEVESNQARQYRDIEEKKVADELERTNKILAFRKAMEANSLEIISSNARQARAIQEKEEIESIKEQDFHRQASLNSYRNDRISMYTQMFNEIDAKEKAAAEETKKRATETHGHLDRLMMRTASIVAAMASYRLISAFVQVPEEILKTNIEMEKLRVLLEGVTGSAQNARLEFNRLLTLDVKTPFDIKGLTETFVMLKNYGLEPTDMVMKSLTDSVAKLGGSTEQLIGIGRQLGQAWAKDKLQQIDMRPMIENGLPVISLLASALHTTTAEILEMSKAGTIGREQMLLLFAEMQKDAPNAAARNMDTLRGSLSNVVTAWTQFQDAILEDKSESTIKRIFETWSSILFRWRDDISGVVNQTNAMAENLMKLEKVRSQMPVAQKNPIAAELMSLLGLGDTYAELVEKEKDLLGIQDKILTAMEKESIAAYKLKETSESKLELDKKALELSEKQEKALIRQLEFEDKINQSKMELANTVIDSKIKDEQRLNTTKVAGYELERKQNDEAYSRNEISAKRRYDVEIDLIQKLKAAEFQKLNEIESLEKQKLATKVLDVDKAWLAVLEVEDKSGKQGTVNAESMAMGPGQAMPRTLLGINKEGKDVGVGFGMAKFQPAVDENLMGMLKDYNKVKDFATRHDAELKEWAEKYWKALVLHYGTVEEALKHYGDGTVKYSNDVMAAYAMITGATKDQIKLDDAAKDTLDERAKASAKFTAMEVEAKNKLIKASDEYQKMLDSENLQIIQITGTSVEYTKAELAFQEKYNEELKKSIAIGDKEGESIARRLLAVKAAKPFSDLQKENDLIISNNEAQAKFNDQLSKTAELYNKGKGTITEEQFKKEAEKLAKAYNEQFIEPAETYTKRMSQFAIQAARNMQSSFAQFLYDPFKDGLKGMLTGFIDMLRKMAAEAAAASIFDKLLGTKNSAGVSTGGLLGGFLDGILGSSTKGATDATMKFTGGPGWFASGGDFGGGYRVVGEQGPELEVTGPSRIFNAQQTKDMLSKGSNTTVNNVTIQVQAAKGDNPSDVGSKAAEAFMRTIAKQEITNANRPGNQLNRTTTFGV